VDLAPTLLAVAGVPSPSSLDGRVLAAITGSPAGSEAPAEKKTRSRPAAAPRRIYMEAAAPYLEYGWRPLAGIVEGDRKVVVAPAGRVEAFDLAADPAGTTALAKAPRWAGDLARAASERLGSLDPPEERRQKIAAAAAAFEFPWGNSPFCAEKIAFPDPRDPDRVGLAALLYPARFDFDLGLPGYSGLVAIKVADRDPANLTVLELITVYGLRSHWGDMLLDTLEVMTCNYPYRIDGYHYLGHFYAEKKDQQRALELFRIMSVVDPREEEAEYDIACTLAAMGRKDEAFEHLRRAIELGAHEFELMRRDGRLGPLRGDPRFDEMVPESEG
jgi:tetratricopeptide (TPR) repeat protein